MLISICIPTYNRSQSLLNCLNSLCLQTNNSFEVCISDNCSDYNDDGITDVLDLIGLVNLILDI